MAARVEHHPAGGHSPTAGLAAGKLSLAAALAALAVAEADPVERWDHVGAALVKAVEDEGAAGRCVPQWARQAAAAFVAESSEGSPRCR